jgi:uncharacterized protein
MTQPAKVQEPSMEEILASIRRIIADDEAKPPAAEAPASAAPAAKPEKPAAPAKAPAMKDIPPSALPAAQAAAAKPAPPPVKPAAAPPAAPAPAVSNSQDDIDALLNGLDESTSAEEIRPPLPDGEVFELTDDMAVAMAEPPQPPFRKVEPRDDLEFTESAAARALHRLAFEPPPLESVPRHSRYCRTRPCRRSNPRSIRWLIPCSATTRGRWKTWSRKCSAQC